MKAIGFNQSLAISETDSFIEFEMAKPAPSGFDILVKSSFFKQVENHLKRLISVLPLGSAELIR